MKISKTRNRILEEIDKIPEEKLIYLYDLIHFFRLGLETKKSSAQDILKLAGSWKDMSEEAFNDFLNEIKGRRQHFRLT